MLASAALLLGCEDRLPAHTLDLSNAFLWEATHADGGAGRLYLLGSIHYADFELVLDPAIEALFETSDALMVEVDTTQLDPEALAAAPHEWSRLPDEELGSASRLSAETRARLDAYLAEYPLPADRDWQVERTKPWLFVMWMWQNRATEGGGGSFEAGVDSFFLDLARARGLPIESLETLEDQYRAMNAVPLAQQAAALAAQLEERERADAFARRAAENPDDEAAEQAAREAARKAAVAGAQETLRIWKYGDEAVLADRLRQPEGSPMEAFHAEIFRQRNRRMVQKLAAALDAGEQRFVVVGAGHLVGRASLVELLRERGYAVRRVRAEAGAVEGKAQRSEVR